MDEHSVKIPQKEILRLKKFKTLMSYIHKENPFITASLNFKKEFEPLFNEYFSNTNIIYQDFRQLTEETQFQLLVIEISNKVYPFFGDEIAKYIHSTYTNKFILNILWNDSFKEIWCELVLKGMSCSFVHVSIRASRLPSGKRCLYAYDFANKMKFNKYLPSLYSSKHKNFEIDLKGFSYMRWKQIGFVTTLAKCNLDWLFNGPPSFHTNKELLMKLLKKFPEYYFSMRNRKLRKDTDITKTVINAKPELIEKIPRQYIGDINLFILSKATEKNPEDIKKYVGECRGIVCITGKLKSFKTKKEATQALELQGFAVSKNLTIECDYLISEGNVLTTKLIKVLDDKKAKYSVWGNPYRNIVIIKNLERFLKDSKHSID